MTVATEVAPATSADRALRWTIASLVGAQALVVGLQVVGRLVLRRPIPWTEEVARLLKEAYTSPEEVIAAVRQTIEFGEIKMVK